MGSKNSEKKPPPCTNGWLNWKKRNTTSSLLSIDKSMMSLSSGLGWPIGWLKLTGVKLVDEVRSELEKSNKNKPKTKKKSPSKNDITTIATTKSYIIPRIHFAAPT